MQRRRRRGLCLRGYRWCGPGCHGPGAPLNGVDSCCQKHDLCYQKYGPSCICDKELLDCLDSRQHLRNREGRDARLFYDFMKLKFMFNCR
jgi:hypothetical protein